MIPQVNLAALAPMIVLALAGVAVLLLQACLPGLRRASGYVALGAAVLALGLTAAGLRSGTGDTPFPGMAVSDGFALAFDLTLLVAALLTILLSLGSGRLLDRAEYYCLLLFSVTGMMIMAHGTNLVAVFIGLETLSVPLYALTGFYRNDPRSSEAAMKYFILGAFSTAFLLYGMALLYGATGTLVFDGLKQALAARAAGDPLLLAALGFVVVGFGFKLSIVPFHMWTPDAYDGAPTPIAGFMSVGTKAAAFAALLRLLETGIPTLEVKAVPAVYALAVLTMTVGNVIALTQRNIKRMLAFSSIAHAGYMLVGIVAGKRLGSPGILFYLAGYAFMNIGAFGVIALIERGKPREDDPEIAGVTLSDLTGAGRARPMLAAAMALFMFSLIGIPPTVGFVGKFYLFAAAVKEGYYILAVIGVLNSAVAAYYYLRVVVTMYMKEPPEVAAPAPASPIAGRAALLLAACGTLVLGIAPSRLYDLMAAVAARL